MKQCAVAFTLFTMLNVFINPGYCEAKPVSQVIPLKSGWNAIFLEVEPHSNSRSPEKVFKNVANLKSVWTLNQRHATAEFIQDPGSLIPGQEHWRVYLPENPVLTNLHAIFSERAYLVEIEGTNIQTSLTIAGNPTLPSLKWKADSFNLVGFHIDPSNLPFFGEFFSSSPAHDGQEIYYLQDGEWRRINNPALYKMKQGEAFWVYCQGNSDFQGPLSVQMNQSSGMHFNTMLSTQLLHLDRNSEANAEITINLQSETSPFPMYYWDQGDEVADPSWQTFPLSFSVGPGERTTLQLGVRRAGLPLLPDPEYSANLEITDGNGMRLFIPASVEAVSYTGLWVGGVAIRKVSEPRTGPEVLHPVGSELSFRLIIHIDSAGQVHILKQAIQLWDSNQKQYVLVTDDNLIPTYMDDSAQQEKYPLRRISSAAFSRFGQSEEGDSLWDTALAGNFSNASGTVTTTVSIDQDDPLNPFFHKYHSKHGDPTLTYQITRAITLEFSETDSEGNNLAGDSALTWGGSDIGGIYRETLSGLHKNDIHVEGIFMLHKVNSIAKITHKPD